MIELEDSKRCTKCPYLYSDIQQHMCLCYYPIKPVNLTVIWNKDNYKILKIGHTGGENGHYYTIKPDDCPLMAENNMIDSTNEKSVWNGYDWENLPPLTEEQAASFRPITKEEHEKFSKMGQPVNGD